MSSVMVTSRHTETCGERNMTKPELQASLHLITWICKYSSVTSLDITIVLTYIWSHNREKEHEELRQLTRQVDKTRLDKQFQMRPTRSNLQVGYSYIKVDQYKQETALQIAIIVITTKVHARGNK